MQPFPNFEPLAEEHKYDFFISYSHKDKEVALDLYYLALANGLVPWLDDRNLEYGEEVQQRALLGVHNSKQFLVIISKDSIESDSVQNEISEAFRILDGQALSDKPFKVTAFRIDSTHVTGRLKDYLYIEDRTDHPLPATLKLIQDLTGKDMFGRYMHGAYAGLLNSGIAPTPGFSLGLFNAYSHLVLMQIKSLLKDASEGRYPHEALSTIQQLVNTSAVFNEVPTMNTWLSLGNGVFESIHPVRSFRTPQVRVLDLPPEIDYLVCENNEVITRLQFVWNGTTNPVLSPFPFRINLDAEIY